MVARDAPGNAPPNPQELSWLLLLQAAKSKNLAGCQLIGVNLATAQNTGRAFEAIAELREVVEQQNRAITYLLNQD